MRLDRCLSPDAARWRRPTARWPPAQTAPPPGQPPALKQIALTEKQIEDVLAAQKDIDAITEKLPDNAKPDPKVAAQLEAVAKKNGFASYDEYNNVVDNVSLVLAGFDPATKKYVGYGSRHQGADRPGPGRQEDVGQGQEGRAGRPQRSPKGAGAGGREQPGTRGATIKNGAPEVKIYGQFIPDRRGATIKNGAPEVKIYGQFIPIRAQVASLEQFSDHADPPEMLEWLRTFKNKPAATYLVHGEPAASSQLRDLMKKELGWNVQVAEYMERVEIK